jgi:hypothetical protein
VVTARVDGAHPVQVNESIDLFVRGGESHLFDPDTSLAIPRLG